MSTPKPPFTSPHPFRTPPAPVNRKVIGAALWVAVVASLGSAPAAAQGMLWPRRIINIEGQPISTEVPKAPLSTSKLKIEVKITDQVAHTHVSQTFRNHTPMRMEGEYMFVLPREASVSGFALEIDGKTMQGELLAQDKARGIYEGIVRSMKDPALLECMGRGLFKARIFPIEPHGERRIEMSYQQVLPRDFGLAGYTYPLRSPTAMAEPVGDMVLSLTVESSKPLRAIYSPSHTVASHRSDDKKATLSFEGKSVPLDRDFSVYYSASTEGLGVDVMTYRPSADEDGYFMLLVSPAQVSRPGEAQAKDVVFVMDTSGSMQGDRIDQARKALTYCVQALGRTDRFNLVTFATEATKFADTLLDANDANVKKAVTFVKDEVRAAGGTNIEEGVRTALSMRPAQADRPFMVVFVTDGEPTIGVVDPKEIVEAVKKASDGRVRVFTFGVGDDLNAKLVDEIAEATGAVSEYVTAKEDMEVKISNFYNRIATPVLTGLGLSWEALRTTEVYPKRMPDLFAGGQLTLMGRYKEAGAGHLKLTGRRGAQDVEFRHEVNLPTSADKHDFLPRLWATRKVGYLLDEIRLHGENAELKEEVVRLARKYALVTPYTSYLVVEDKAATRVNAPSPGLNSRANWGGAIELEDRLEPQETASSDRAPRALSESTGRRAVAASQAISRMKLSASDEGAPSAPAGAAQKDGAHQAVGDRTFGFVNGFWVQSDWVEGKAERPTVRVAFASEAFFALAAKYPEVARCASLGKRVRMMLKGRALVLDEDEKPGDLTVSAMESTFGK